MSILIVTSNKNTLALLKEVATEIIAKDIDVKFLSTAIFYGASDDSSLLLSDFNIINDCLFSADYYKLSVISKVSTILRVRNSINKLFCSVNITGVVLASDMQPLERIIIEEASSRHIPTYLIQDGILTNKFPLFDIDICLPWHPRLALKILFKHLLSLIFFTNGKYLFHKRWGSSQPTIIFVYSDYFSLLLIGKYTNSKTKYISVGSNKFKNFVNSRIKYALHNKYKVVIATSSLGTNFGKMYGKAEINAILNLCESIYNLDNNIQIYVKVHPNEDVDYYNIINVIYPDVIIIKDISVAELLELADLVITSISTLGVEALSCGVPTIVIAYKYPSFANRMSFYNDINYPYIAKSNSDFTRLFNIFLNEGLFYDLTNFIRSNASANREIAEIIADQR